MSTRTALRTAAVLTVAGALVVAGTSAADAASGRKTLNVSASSKHHVTVSKTTQPGVVHLHNKSGHELVLVKKKHKGLSDFVKESNASDDSDSPKVFKDFDVVEIVSAHADDFVKLTKGTYYVADGDVDTLKTSYVATVTVKGKTSNAHVPGSRLVEVDSHKLVAPPAMVKGNYLHVVNATSALRFFAAVGIKSSATDQQIKDAMADKTGKKFQAILSGTGGVLGYVGAHHDITTHSTIGRGRYLVYSFSLSGDFGNPFGDPHMLKVMSVK